MQGQSAQEQACPKYMPPCEASFLQHDLLTLSNHTICHRSLGCIQSKVRRWQCLEPHNWDSKCSFVLPVDMNMKCKHVLRASI